jgi:hypothetical protein
MSWFTRDKKATEVEPRLRRICDISTMRKLLDEGGEVRETNRLAQAIPVLLCPLEEGEPETGESFVAVAKDISDTGVGLILHQPLRTKEVILGFWLGAEQSPEPWFFRATVRRNQPMGGGLWVLGLELAEFLNNGDRQSFDALIPVAKRLVPDESPCSSTKPSMLLKTWA